MTRAEAIEYCISREFYGHADGLPELTEAIFFGNFDIGVDLRGESLSTLTERYKGYSRCGDDLMSYSMKGLDSIKLVN